MWEEWALIFSPWEKSYLASPMEPPASLSMSTILEFLPPALVAALGSITPGATYFDYLLVT